MKLFQGPLNAMMERAGMSEMDIYDRPRDVTGAGLGAKGQHKRNFETGMLTDDPGHLRELMDWIDQLYLGEFCQKCQRRAVCPDPIA